MSGLVLLSLFLQDSSSTLHLGNTQAREDVQKFDPLRERYGIAPPPGKNAEMNKVLNTAPSVTEGRRPPPPSDFFFCKSMFAHDEDNNSDLTNWNLYTIFFPFLISLFLFVTRRNTVI